jgi:hypothetical protein
VLVRSARDGETRQGVTYLGNLKAISPNLNAFLTSPLLSFRSRVVDVKKVPDLGRGTRGTLGGFMDIIYVGVGLLFFALSWGFVTLCERL